MKKILFASSLLALASTAPSMASAAAAGLAAGPNAVAFATACTLLSADVSITLSSGNIGAYDCNTSSANIGVAVGATTGKNKVFSIGSSGGALTTTTTSAAPTSTDAGGAASTAASS